jgi:hypothetical protein
MEVSIQREITQEFEKMYYSFQTIREWQKVWKAVCEMGYNPEAKQYTSIVVHSETSDAIDGNLYGYYTVQNQHLICLDTVWRDYDRLTPIINKNLKTIYVPRVLFNCMGVINWFHFSFPNCEVKFWNE